MKRGSFAILFVVVLLVGIVFYNAPRFLIYADKPVKSDAIILYMGDNSLAREKEAWLLLKEGYAKLLIIPALHQVFDASHSSPLYARAANNAASSPAGRYSHYYENTHVEVLGAQRMMNALGLKSAIMVSSPYHMKRIKMICEKTFGEQARSLSYVPTRYQAEPINVRDMGWGDWSFVIREYIKICWFRLYAIFL